MLLALLAGACVLYRWSRTGDARFHEFVRTRTGHALARAFSWHAVMPEAPVPDKPDSAMTEEELSVKRSLEDEIAAGMPTHRLVFTDGEEMEGRVLEASKDSVVFVETYGESGSMSVNVPRSRIRQLMTIPPALPGVTYRDVRFRMEFPGLRLYKREPYTVMTDESWFRVEATVKELVRLYRDFMQVFGELVTVSERRDDIQVLFFSREDAFKAYQEKYAPQLPGAGFYSPWIDRLIVFNQETAAHVARARKQVAEEVAKHRAELADRPAALARLDAWRSETEKHIARFAEAQTVSTVRHEGAHQLFFSFGVHSINRIENEWVFEGLAAYCETPRFGEHDQVRVGVLKRAQQEGSLIPLVDLVNLRHEAGLMSYGLPPRVELAYAQSWSLVCWLMEGERRRAFFDYLLFVRDPANLAEVRRAPAMDILCRFLDASPDEVGKSWLEYVQRM